MPYYEVYTITFHISYLPVRDVMNWKISGARVPKFLLDSLIGLVPQPKLREKSLPVPIGITPNMRLLRGI